MRSSAAALLVAALPVAVLPLAASLSGCHRPPAGPVADLPATDALSAALRFHDAGLVPVSARFGLTLVQGDSTVNASGAMVIRPGGSLRIEISGPIGPPALVIAADGHALHALQTGKNTFYSADDAEGALRTLTGGAAGLDIVTALLVGQLAVPTGGPVAVGPMPGESASGGTYVYQWCRETGGCLAEGISRATGRLLTLHATGPDGATLLDATLQPGSEGPYPSALTVTLPSLHTSAAATFHAWTPATPPDAAFTLTAPPGATVLPLPPKP
jgi:hypothetical protein